MFALLGLGLVLCYRSSRVVNLAQGETFMATGMLTAKLTAFGVPLALAAPAGIAFAVVLSICLALALQRRLHWPVQRLIIVTVGAALFAEGVASVVMGADAYSFRPPAGRGTLHIAGAAIAHEVLLVIAVGVVLAIGLMAFFRRTVIGHALAAVAEKPATASTLGINVNAMRVFAFGLAGLLSGIAAIVLVPISPVNFNVGLSLTLSAYVAAAAGNLLNPGVTCVAGFGVGLTESFFGAYVNQLLAEPVVLGVLLIVVVSVLSRRVRFGGAVRA